MSGIQTMIDNFNQDTIAILKNLIELHTILKLDNWEQDVARIKERILVIERKMKNDVTGN